VKPPIGIAQALEKLIASPELCSKRWVWEQYDHVILGNTVQRPGGDAAVVRVQDGPKGLALTVDVTPRYCEADPYQGGKQAVAEAWRNITAVGGRPLAITDNLNFGNPERPEIMGQIARAIDGMAEACLALDFPVVSGNVSLYNETDGVAIPPTPTVGAVGLIPDYALRADFASMQPGDALLVVGASHGELGSSLYLRELFGREDGAPPPVDLEFERRNGDFVRRLIRSRMVSAVHDLSDGGLAIAAAEMALASNVGLELSPTSHAHAHAFLFGEDQGRYLIATAEPDPIVAAGRQAGLNIALAGQAGGADFACHELFRVPLDRLRAAHEEWMPAYMGA
jgi:phosphoribosylformylglycinamidine synthase